jgi:FG-GAP-like repeat
MNSNHLLTRHQARDPHGRLRRSRFLRILLLSSIPLLLVATSWENLLIRNGSSYSQTRTPETSVQFIHHILDSDLYTLGADIGDVDSHGLAEIIACDAQGIYWYAQSEKHIIDHFTTPTLFIHLRTADIDRDGDIDVVAVDHRNGNLFYYENPGPGSAKARPWPRHLIDDKVVGAHAVTLADINRDGRTDVVASGEAEAEPPSSVFWYSCHEKPTEAVRWPKHVLGPGQSGGLAHYPGIGDVNGDGRLDVVHAAKQGEWYRMWLQPEDPNQAWVFKEVGKGYVQATNIQVADVNGDGRADLVATQGHHVGILWFEGPAMVPHYIDQSLRSPHTLAVADIDSDGDIDVVTCAFESKVLAWFENKGRGEFEQHDISLDQQAYDLVARDVDGDGDLDLVVAGQESRTLSWYEQVGRPRGKVSNPE